MCSKTLLCLLSCFFPEMQWMRNNLLLKYLSASGKSSTEITSIETAMSNITLLDLLFLQDWEKHQSIHHYSQDYSGRASVQSRLKIPTSPINAPPKEKSDDKLKRSDTIENQFKSGREVKLQPSKVDSVSSISQSVSLATKDTKETLVELTLLKLKKARKFKTHVSLDDLKDEDGFSCVKVT